MSDELFFLVIRPLRDPLGNRSVSYRFRVALKRMLRGLGFKVLSYEPVTCTEAQRTCVSDPRNRLP